MVIRHCKFVNHIDVGL